GKTRNPDLHIPCWSLAFHNTPLRTEVLACNAPALVFLAAARGPYPMPPRTCMVQVLGFKKSNSRRLDRACRNKSGRSAAAIQGLGQGGQNLRQLFEMGRSETAESVVHELRHIGFHF